MLDEQELKKIDELLKRAESDNDIDAWFEASTVITSVAKEVTELAQKWSDFSESTQDERNAFAAEVEKADVLMQQIEKFHERSAILGTKFRLQIQVLRQYLFRLE